MACVWVASSDGRKADGGEQTVATMVVPWLALQPRSSKVLGLTLVHVCVHTAEHHHFQPAEGGVPNSGRFVAERSCEHHLITKP